MLEVFAQALHFYSFLLHCLRGGGSPRYLEWSKYLVLTIPPSNLQTP